MKIASATYNLDFLPTWEEYAAKQTAWVERASGADLMLFPEYGGMELAALSGAETAIDPMRSLSAPTAYFDQMINLFKDLAKQHNAHICTPSAPVQIGEKIVNRAALIAPSGAVGYQDKQIMTRFEAEEWGVTGGNNLQVFDTDIGKIAILICYDSEFPLLGRAIEDAEVILIPSCTEALSGFCRVRIGAQARALEGQCITVMSSLTGAQPALYGVEESIGKAGIFCPPDQGFPQTGILAEAGLGAAGWTIAEVDIAAARNLRKNGQVLNHRDWAAQLPRSERAKSVTLS